MELLYYLNVNSKGVGYVYYSVRCADGKLTDSAKTKTTKEHWDKYGWSKIQKLRNLKSKVDTYLTQKDNILEAVYKDEIKTFIDELLGGIQGSKKQTVYDMLEAYRKDIQGNKILKDGKAYSNAKKNALRYTLEHVQAMYIGKKDIKLVRGEDIVQFQNYLFEKGLSKTSVGTYTVHLMSMFKETFKIHKNPIHKEEGLGIKPDTNDDAIFLTTDEILRIYNTPVPDWLVKYRDKFVYGCQVGLRFSDLNKNVTPDSLQNDILSIGTSKSEKNVVIPFTKLAKEIWDKYDGNLPNFNQITFNINAKKVCKLADIVEPILIVKTVKGKRVERYTPKYLLVSSHTMRRSLATNLLLAGAELHTVQRILAHSDIRTTLKYFKATNKQVAEKLKNSELFKKFG